MVKNKEIIRRRLHRTFRLESSPREINISSVHFLLGKRVSQVAKLSSKDIKGWLERETGPLLVPIHSKAEKMLDEMSKCVDSLSSNSRLLLDNSQKEIEKRNMKIYKRARALNKLARIFVDRMRQIKVPEDVAYDSFQEFVQGTQKAFSVTDIDIRNWFPLVSPFFIIDRRKFQAVFERAKITLRELDNFSTKEYVKAKTLERTFQLIDKLQALEQQLQNLKEQCAMVGNEKTIVEGEIVEVQRRIADLKSKGGLDQLSQMDTEMRALGGEVKQSLQHLQKPFIKLQSLALHGEGSGLTPEELNKLNQYIIDPFQALATEPPNHPLLRQILGKMNSAMSEGKLKLKPEKIRKAEQIMENVLSKNSLVGLHEKSTKTIMLHRQLSASDQVAETGRSLSKLGEQLEGLERKRKAMDGERITLERACAETSEKIRNHKVEIEKNVFDSTNKRIQLE